MAKVKGKPRGKPFQVGEDPRRPVIDPATDKPAPKSEYVPPDEGVPKSLADRQHIFRNPDKKHDKTGEQKNLRLFFQRKPDQFIAQMEQAEEKHRLHQIELAKVRPAGMPSDEELIEDMGTDAALQVIDDLYRKELAKVKCPQCGHVGLEST